MSVSVLFAAADTDYTKGILIVNEDWYGHQNSTVNYLMPDDPEGNYWHYRVIQAENPGKQLGCTNQYGALWGDRLYFIAKQERDPGADITGGRITVADARTLKILHQQTTIDPSGALCDGRAFVGVDEHKGYVSSHNGVWGFDLDTYRITGMVTGTDNPNSGNDDSKPNDDPTGPRYHGQCGTMVNAAGRIFVAHQQYGLLVVDPTTDSVTDVIPMDKVKEGAGIGSVVLAADGNLWCSIARDTDGSGASLPYLLKVNPSTLESTVVALPEGSYGPANSWYAWTPDAFAASQNRHVLLWNGGLTSWFSGKTIYEYDIDTEALKVLIDLKAEGENWNLYGCSMGIDPANDDIYMSLYHQFALPTYITRRYNAKGEKIRDYAMIDNYWFPSNMIFRNAESGIGRVEEEAAPLPEQWFTLGGVALNERPTCAGIYIHRGTDGKTRKIILK